MNKVLLIIQREYMVRVQKKSFIMMIFLVPGLILAMFGVIYLIASYSNDMNKVRTVWVMDESGVFAGKFHSKDNLSFEPVKKSLIDEKAYLPITTEIQTQMNDISIGNVMVKANIDTAKLHSIKSDISIASKQITDKGEEDSSVGAAYGAGIAGAILVYLALFIYGAQVMRGVLEEKTSRIIEVIVSSVKPFQLMLGKIIGVGLVGLTQFVLWIVLSTGVTYIAGNMLMKDKIIPAKTAQMKEHQPIKTQTSPSVSTVPQSPAVTAYNSFKTVNFPYILGCFLFYFLSGFFLYAALFAAVGSAVDSETETQQFMFPITLPLLFTYIISFSFLINNPDSTLAIWLSEIPFTAPVAMMVRIPFGVPVWQLALSMFMMVIGFLFTTWVAARIYRVGILMYGKKATYKELAKWFFYKE